MNPPIEINYAEPVVQNKPGGPQPSQESVGGMAVGERNTGPFAGAKWRRRITSQSIIVTGEASRTD